MGSARLGEMSDEACAAALARLPGMGPATLVALLSRHSPVRAWELVLAGQVERPRRVTPRAQAELFEPGLAPPGRRGGQSWASFGSRVDVVGSWAKARGAGIRVAWFGSTSYPEALASDPNPPGVLYWRGSLDCLSRRTVAIVGTRNATPGGRATAFELGRDLAEAGVCVVSGLALGIDGAAHHGALAALDGARGPGGHGLPLGVAASGVDVPYPPQQAPLWERVCAAGAVVSETPPGQPAQAWRFPTRNRIIAALSTMVVVVESHPTGGSLITAEAALERGIEVRVVPGPVRSPASAGSNQLLYDGAGPVRNAQDVLDALGLFRSGQPPPGGGGSGLPASRRRASGRPSRRGRPALDPGRLSPEESTVLAAAGWEPSSLGQVMDRTGLGLGQVAAALEGLEAQGLLGRHGGWWARV